MPFLTRSQGMAAFDHVMGDVLGRPILKSALESEGIQDIYSLLMIDEETIDGLVYSDKEGKTTIPLPRGDKNLIKVFLAPRTTSTVPPLVTPSMTGSRSQRRDSMNSG